MKTKDTIFNRFLGLAFLLASCQSIATQPVEPIENNDLSPVKADVSTEISPVIGSQTINGVTITIDWATADAKRVSFGFTIDGLPEVPDAIDLFGTVQLIEKSGTGELGWGGHSIVSRMEGSPDVLVGSWSSVFANPFTQPKGQFGLDIILGNDDPEYNINYTIASFPLPVDATAFPPNVFPPKLPDRRIGEFHFDFETEIYPMLELAPGQSMTANGIEMRLEKLYITPTFSTVVLCYQKPSSKDWAPGRSALEASEREELNNAYGLVFDSEYGSYAGDYSLSEHSLQLGRCTELEFLLGHSNISGLVTLTIPALEQSIPEVIPDDELALAREKLLPQGIDIDWQVASFPEGGGMSGPVYNQLPEGMTEQEAYEKFIHALGYIYEGPWEFHVKVQP